MTTEERSADSTVDRLAGRAHEAIDSAHERARQVTADVSEKTRAVEAGVDQAAARTARGLHSAARRLRGTRSEGGTLASAVESVAGTIDHVGSYLEEDAFGRLRTDLEGMIRRNPVRTVLACAAVGYLVARRRRH
jgi:vacuolar-type H+-ATPase subunit H